MATKKRRRRVAGVVKFTLGDRSKLLSLLTRAQRAANAASKGKGKGGRKRKRARARKRRRYW